MPSFQPPESSGDNFPELYDELADAQTAISDLLAINQGDKVVYLNADRGAAFRSGMLGALMLGDGLYGTDFCQGESPSFSVVRAAHSYIAASDKSVLWGDSLAVGGSGAFVTIASRNQPVPAPLPVTGNFVLMGQFEEVLYDEYAFAKDQEEFQAMVTEGRVDVSCQVAGYMLQLGDVKVCSLTEASHLRLFNNDTDLKAYVPFGPTGLKFFTVQNTL